MSALKSNTYEWLDKQDEDLLCELLTQNDSSVSKTKAAHILEKRRMKPLVEAAQKSASSARCSAIAAIVSAIIALASSIFLYISKP